MKQRLQHWLTLLVFGVFSAWYAAMPMAVLAQGEVLGIHILNPHELDDASDLLKTNDEQWHYVTIPLSIDQLENKNQWQDFFNTAKKNKIIPIVRMTTRFEDGAWAVPNKKEITDWFEFLGELDWPTNERHVIILNEPNHKKEFGGKLDPAEYARILTFSLRWARSERLNYIVLPAGMDLAAPNGPQTMEAFTYLEGMRQENGEIFTLLDVWNSHSYPNPGFSSSPERSAQNSLRGFQHELAYLKEHTGRDFKVYITETGWVENNATRRWLEQYYRYAMEHIWSNPQVVAVTPFILRGDPGPFAGFTFLKSNGEKSVQYEAYRNIIVEQQSRQS